MGAVGGALAGQQPRTLAIGSNKSCYGHTEGAAGVQGVQPHRAMPSRLTRLMFHACALLCALQPRIKCAYSASVYRPCWAAAGGGRPGSPVPCSHCGPAGAQPLCRLGPGGLEEQAGPGSGAAAAVGPHASRAWAHWAAGGHQLFRHERCECPHPAGNRGGGCTCGSSASCCAALAASAALACPGATPHAAALQCSSGQRQGGYFASNLQLQPAACQAGVLAGPRRRRYPHPAHHLPD